MPRLYRLLRILRLFKLFKIMKTSKTMQKFLEKIQLNAGIGRMLLVIVFAIFAVHLISCFWFLAAKFDDFDPDTWVARLELQNLDSRS